MVDTADTRKPFHIWEGIYPDFASAAQHARGPGFSGRIYLERSFQTASECLTCLEAKRPIPAFHKQRSTHLPLTVAMMLEHRERLKVLDFGGGFGIGYLTLLESLVREIDRVDYAIVELPEVCERASALHAGRISYRTQAPSEGGVDLLHAASSLQYVEDWPGWVASMTSLSPEYILLSDVFAGDIHPYVTLQNYYESRIPHWFLALDALVAVFARQGYTLMLKNFATSQRLDAVDTLPMGNFPEECRLDQTLHLLLRRKRDA